MVFTSVKTGVETRLPLRLLFQGKALLLLNKYRKDLEFFFRLKKNSLVNKELIRIGKLGTNHPTFFFPFCQTHQCEPVDLPRSPDNNSTETFRPSKH